MRKWRTAIFVNGCFWHGHDCQSDRRPSTNAKFWQEKIDRNRERDAHNVAALQAAGWHVLVVWECQLSAKRRQQTLRELDVWLSHIVLEHTARPKRYAELDGENELSIAAEPD